MELREYLQKTGIALASRNRKKAAELARLLEPFHITVRSAAELGFDKEIPETATDFEGNAFIKASTVCSALHMPAVADDSGLCVDALNGEPGVYSARYGGEGLDDTERVMLLLENMKGVPAEKRTAKFVSVICLCVPPDAAVISPGRDGMSTVIHTKTGSAAFFFRGEALGLISDKPKGEGGFGYDPVFLNPGTGLTFAELDPASKDAISHRGRAVRKFRDFLNRS